MEKRKRIVTDKKGVVGKSILAVYRWYRDELFTVNRQYQRKLVWELEEKQKFIDTLLHLFPVPIFLLVDCQGEERGASHYEIIDGLQRLEAIFSFIDGKYKVKWGDIEGYFNLEAIPGYGAEVRSGNLKQNMPVLDLEVCNSFLEYELPLSFTQVSDEAVEEIFRRINSSGKKLSNQDLRQAGVTGWFSDVVRKTASYIRGDYTEVDVVPLKEMPTISYTNKGLCYGISILESFWHVHGILTEKNIRSSLDEELLAKMYAYILLGENASSTTASLESAYREESKLNRKLENAIIERGMEHVMAKFSRTLSTIIDIFESVHSTYAEWVFYDINTSRKANVFQALFLAIYDLQKEGYCIEDYVAVAKKLKDVGDKRFVEITGDRDWNKDVRNKAICEFKDRLRPVMVFYPETPELKEQRVRVERLLDEAADVEQQFFDVKLGITNLSDGSLNVKCISKIIKTLTAMANTNIEKEGHIIIGIADSKTIAMKCEELYKSRYYKYGRFYVVGIDGEADKFRNGIDEYSQLLKQQVEMEPIAPEVKDYILKKFEFVKFEGRHLCILSYKSNGSPIFYNEKLYVRYGSSVKEVKPGSPEFNELMKSIYGAT